MTEVNVKCFESVNVGQKLNLKGTVARKSCSAEALGRWIGP